MNEQQIQHALAIMNQLIEHPITKIFYKPFSNENVAPGYFDKIKQPQNLSDIIEGLKNGKICECSDWLKSVELCWSNSETLTGINKYHIIVANECRKLFNKLRRGTDFVHIKGWCNDVYILQKRELKHARHAPRKVNACAAGLESYRMLKCEELIPLTNQEIKNFIQATNLIKSDETNRGLMKILGEMQPDIKKANSTECWVDITKLELSTVRALRDYLKTELEKQGDRYPE